MANPNREWTDEELKALEDPATWDWEHPLTRPGNPDTRAVLAVRFSREEARRLFAASEARGQTVLEFVHDAAIAAAEDKG